MNQRTTLRAILAIVLLCGTAYGATATWSDTKGTGDTLTAAEWNDMVTYVTTGGLGDMLKSTYDPNTDGVIAVAQGGTGVTDDTYDADKVDGCDAGVEGGQVFKLYDWPNFGGIYAWDGTSGMGYLAPGTDGYQLTTHGNNVFPSWEPAGDGGLGDMLKSTYDPNTDGVIAVAQGGTGVTDDTYDADKVDGCDAGVEGGQVFKLYDWPNFGGIYAWDGTSGMGYLAPGTDGYQLTTHGNNVFPSWEPAGDLIFSDTHDPKSGKKFEDGDDLVLHVIGHNEVGDILTIPMLLSSAEEPKKVVTIRRKVMEDRIIFDETTGETRLQRMPKMQTKTVTKYRLKEGYYVDPMTGNFKRHDASIHKPTPKTLLTTLKELVIKPNAVKDTGGVTKSEAVEEYEVKSRECVYEDYEVVI